METFEPLPDRAVLNAEAGTFKELNVTIEPELRPIVGRMVAHYRETERGATIIGYVVARGDKLRVEVSGHAVATITPQQARHLLPKVEALGGSIACTVNTQPDSNGQQYVYGVIVYMPKP